MQNKKNKKEESFDFTEPFNSFWNSFSDSEEKDFDGQNFTKNLINSISDFYKKSMEFNPFLGKAMEAIKQNPHFFDNSSAAFGKEAPRIFMEINIIAAEITQTFMQKQQEYLKDLFTQISELIIEVKKNPNIKKNNSSKYFEKTQLLSARTSKYFDDISELILIANKKISKVLSAYCENPVNFTEEQEKEHA
ncbi:MAG: hypothetical protein LBS83_03430 [Holosporales bacterium]|jgi:hypothetical protein|nr:hypothetical protein [Holosporales bacterium]